MADFKVASAYADFEVKVDEGIEAAKARIRQRQRDLDASAKIKLDIDVRDAKSQLRKEFADERFMVKADADTTLARARLEKLTGEGTFKIKPDVDDAGVRRAQAKMDSATSKMAERANNQFDMLKFTAFTVGLPAAAAVGSAATVAALGAIPVAFGAAIVGLTKSTDAVDSRWGEFASTLKSDATTIASQYSGEVVGSIDDMGAAWVRLRPAVDTAMRGAAPQIRELTGAATDLAEAAMPGVIGSMDASAVAIGAVRTVAGQTGQGLSDFFLNASRGAQGSAQGLTIFGGTIQTVLSRAGELAANLGNMSSGPMRSLDTMVNQLTSGLVRLTSQGSGAIGFLQGFGTAGSGIATILNGVAIAATALPPQITQIGGSIAATSMIASKFGVDVGAGFDGLGTKIKSASGTADKFKAGFSGLVGGLLNPTTLAVSALGIGLDILGEEQERAAKYAAEHRDNVRALTQAIREDNGVLGENVAKVNLKALTDKNASANLSVFGENLGDAKLAIEGNADAYDRLNYSARAQLATLADHMNITGSDKEALKNLGTEALKTGKSYDQFNNNITSLVSTMGGEGGEAMRNQVAAIINANGAVGEQINSQKAAMDAYLQSEHALTGLSEAQIKARDATAQHTAANMAAIGGELGYRGAVEATKQAMDTYTKTNKDHKASEDDKAQALLGAEQAMYRQIQAAGAAAAANTNLRTENEKAAASTAAMNRETVNLANTWVGPLPASLQAGISKMDVSSAKAAGLTIAIDDTGNAVYRLPNGKTINIESTADREKAKVDALNSAIQALHDREITIRTTYFYGTVGQGQSLTGAPIARSRGGLVGRLAAASGNAYAQGITSVQPSMASVIGGAFSRSIRDEFPAILAAGETVTNARQTARNYRELVAINSGQRNYEKYPDTGRPPQREPNMPQQRAVPAVDMGGVTIVGVDADEVLAKLHNRMAWAVR